MAETDFLTVETERIETLIFYYQHIYRSFKASYEGLNMIYDLKLISKEEYLLHLRKLIDLFLSKTKVENMLNENDSKRIVEILKNGRL